jgi:osmotically-inducible protein OsmY
VAGQCTAAITHANITRKEDRDGNHQRYPCGGNVKDEIEITDDTDPVDVTWLVQDALDRNALFEDDSDVRVDTTGNTVTLGGHVRTWAEHDAVVGATWMAPGVLQVRDYLDITG